MLAVAQYLEALPGDPFEGPHSGKYLTGYAETVEPTGGHRRFTSFAEASAAALADSSCSGITQEMDDRKYTLRTGSGLLESPSGEISWLKKAGDDPTMHALEPDPCPVVLAGLATLIEELVAAGSLGRTGTAICRLAAAHFQAATFESMDPAELAESGLVAQRMIEAGKQLFDFDLSSSMHAEAKALLVSAIEFFAEANGDVNVLLDFALSTVAIETDGTPRKTTASAAFVSQALLFNIDTVNQAISICGSFTGPVAFKNLEDHETVVGVVKCLLAVAQHVTDTTPALDSHDDAEPPAAGMVGIVAKIQAGIWAQHKNHPPRAPPYFSTTTPPCFCSLPHRLSRRDSSAGQPTT